MNSQGVFGFLYPVRDFGNVYKLAEAVLKS